MARLFDDASNQYLRVTSTPVTEPPFTMACWFYTDDTDIDEVLMEIGDLDDDSHGHWIDADGTLEGDPVCVYSAEGDAAAETASGFSANTWHHAAGVVAASDDRRVYIDGGSKGTDAGEASSTGLDSVNIGAHGNGTPDLYFSGRIAEAAIWNAALSDAEVVELAAGRSPLLVRPQSLVAYWPLVRDGDEDVVGGYDMTPQNAPAVASHPSGIFGRAPISAVAPPVVAPAAAAAGYMTPMRGYWGA